MLAVLLHPRVYIAGKSAHIFRLVDIEPVVVSQIYSIYTRVGGRYERTAP